jgi:uncharacterized protein YrzB (UPF0473 family)
MPDPEQDDAQELSETEVVFVTLTDDEGNEEEFQLIQTVELDGHKYGVLVSAEADVDETKNGAAEDDEDEDDILILRMAEEEGEEYFEEIEDDAEFQKVVAHLESFAEA